MIRRVIACIALAIFNVLPSTADAQLASYSGIAVVEVDRSGNVTGAKMLQSTGDGELDSDVLRIFRTWHFRPGSPSHIKIPVTCKDNGRSRFRKGF